MDAPRRAHDLGHAAGAVADRPRPADAPRPVLLIAAGSDPAEIPTNRRYLEAAGPAAELYEIPDAGHTGGIKSHTEQYEFRVMGFLDRALVGA